MVGLSLPGASGARCVFPLFQQERLTILAGIQRVSFPAESGAAEASDQSMPLDVFMSDKSQQIAYELLLDCRVAER